ncbi:MAG TPA: NnrS family protein [Steroidobacteraceae bacterium]|nr:NnrS family protein [Steroidobacteraceae bacterium]
MPLMKSNLFAYGFRSQFFLAGVAALALVPLWAVSFVAGTSIGSGWPPTLWHAHEMLFGFIASAIAGFMLTAVPSWTGQKGFAGRPLIALALVWLAARLLILTSSLWPPLLPAIVDLAFLPLLGVLVMIPLVRSRNRNTPLLAVLAAFWLTNVVFHVGLWHHDAPLARNALIIGIDITLLLVTVIGGRIVPAFTSAALRQQGIDGALKSRTAVTVLSIAAMVGVIICDMVRPDSRIAGGIAGIAAVLQAVRLVQWRSLRTLRQPIVWILHLAYAWLPVGLGLKAAALLGGYGFAAFWLHALTIGTLTTMITAVMTRASLGHTGRPLTVHGLTTLAYVLLTAAAAARVFGLSFGMSYPTVITVAAILWTAAFALFIGVYAPILWGPRADGKPG